MLNKYTDFIYESKSKTKIIYHFTESIDSLSSILHDDILMSGDLVHNYGRGYENISFTWNPKLWDLVYLGDVDYRYKVRISFDYDRMSKVWKFKPFDYGIDEEMEEIVEVQEMNDISQYITEILIGSTEPEYEIEKLKNEYTHLNIKKIRRKKFIN